jgi:hypothetical protein
MRISSRHENESVLLIVLAETRAFELTFNLLKKNLLEIMNADLCLCVANNHREDKTNPFYQHARYVWSYDEPDDWGDAFDNMQKHKGLSNNWRKLLEIKDQWLGGVKGEGEHPGSAGILLFFRMFLKESIIKHGVLEQYDRFIVTRSDFMHQIPHVPLTLLDPGYIWIPDGEDYGGYTDRHIVVHRNDILDVLSISDRIITDPEKLYSEMCFSVKWNLEKFIKFSFTQLGLVPRIKRYPYTMYSVRLIDGHTRWSGGVFDESLGYYIKYESEYRSHKRAAAFVKKPEDWNKLTIYAINHMRGIMRILKKLRINKFKELQ